MPRWHRSPDVLAHAQRWRVRCLDADSSVFTDRPLWSVDNLAALLGEYQSNFTAGRGKEFLPRLQQQLAAAPPALTQLAAEVLWILFLSLSESAIAGNTKRRLIRDVWELSGEPLPLTSPALGAVLDSGIANPNPGFNINAWREFVFCVQSILQWKKLPLARRVRLLSDPWAFADWLDDQVEADRRQFRHMLLYLLFPEHFERVMAGREKRRILATFLPRFGLSATVAAERKPGAWDRALFSLRPLLEEHYRAEIIDYYRPPVRDGWRETVQRGGSRANTRPAAAIEFSAFLLWEQLADGAATTRQIPLVDITAATGLTQSKVHLGLQEISAYCATTGIPPLELIASEFRSVVADDPARMDHLLEEVFDFAWAAYGNPFGFAREGAEHRSLVARLVVDPDSAQEVWSLVRHRGRAQQIFRQALLRAYDGRCAFSGSCVEEGLEAAHLVPWVVATRAQRLDVRNGVLLTAWLHRLFDAGLIHLDAEYQIRVDARLLMRATSPDLASLAALDGKKMRIPQEEKHRPEPEFIRARASSPPAGQLQ